MLAAAMAASTRDKTDCRDLRNACQARPLPEIPLQAVPMLQLVGNNANHAKANHNLRAGGLDQRHILLVSDQASSSERRGLHLGHPPGPKTHRAPESLRYAP